MSGLWAYEIDTRQNLERSKAQIREKIRWSLKFADISTKADDFVDSATMNPAFEKSAMFENAHDAYVFDTAPTANARRLLGMSKVYSLWVNKMLKSRDEARALREMLSFTKKKEADPLMEYLVSSRDRMEHARVLLSDPALTAFFFVTPPEALPIAVVTRFIQWSKDFGIPVGGVLVNMVIDPASVPAEAAEFVRNRVAMQQEHMRTPSCPRSVGAPARAARGEVAGTGSSCRRCCPATVGTGRRGEGQTVARIRCGAGRSEQLACPG